MTEHTDDTSSRHISYIRRLCLSVLFGVVMVAGASVFFDPYGIYRAAPLIAGLNQRKPYLSRYHNQIKLTHVLQLQPDLLFLGNSRAEIGFDPEDPTLKRMGTSAYNLAIPGTSLANNRRQLQLLLQHHYVPKRIVLALDYVDFLAPVNASTTASAKQAVSPWNFDGWSWRFDALLSLWTLQDMLEEIRIQRATFPSTLTSRGFNPLWEYQGMARTEGYFRLFRQRAEENFRKYSEQSPDNFREQGFEDLRELVSASLNEGIELAIVVYPYHGQMLWLFEAAGLQPSFERWKERVLGELRPFQKEANRLRLFDFSGYNSITCESVPKEGDLVSVTQWYWELGHFKRELGSLVLEEVFQAESVSGPGFEWLTPFRIPHERTIGEHRIQIVPLDRDACLEQIGLDYINQSVPKARSHRSAR